MISKIYPLTESALTIYFEQSISEEINDLVIATANWLDRHPFSGLLELVPAYASLTVFYDLAVVSQQADEGQSAFAFVKNHVSAVPLNRLLISPPAKRIIEIEVAYTGEDLPIVATHTGLSIQKIVELHSCRLYRVYIMGFLPGFGYLGTLDPRLAIPRKSKPKRRVPAGSVAIAGLQTAIYPFESPGGWHLIGHSKAKLFDADITEMSLLTPGSYVKFIPL